MRVIVNFVGFQIGWFACVLGAANSRPWVGPLVVLFLFLVHLALATLVGGIVLATQRFKPLKASGYILTVLIGLLCAAALAVFTGLFGWVVNRASPLTSNFTATPLGLVSPTPGLPPSATPGAPTRTFTLTVSPEPSATFTGTPAPSYAVIKATTGGGALVRSEPGGGTVLTTLINGTFVEVLPEIRAVGTVQWVRIRTQTGMEGWVLQTVLAAATPAPTASVSPAHTP